MPSVLKISEAASMALHAVCILTCTTDGPVATKTMASALRCSEAHLSKVLQRLTKAKLLSATRGPRGGFVLARSPEEISLLEVYEAIDGELSNIACLFEDQVCTDMNCFLGSLLVDINEMVRIKLSNTQLNQVDCRKWPWFKVETQPAAEDN